MEITVFKKKIDLLARPEDRPLKEALSDVLSQSVPGTFAIRDQLKSLFVKSFARLCREEGIENLSSPDHEEALKDRLPDTVANWLTVLSEILSEGTPSQRVEDPAFTAAVLLLRLYEWINWNYDRRLIYGSQLEQEAEKRFEGLENEMDLLGDKDEILAQTMDSLSGFCSNFWIDESSLLPGVRTYFVRVDFDYGQGVKGLQVGIKSVLFDQVKIRALCPDQHILSHILESLLQFSSLGISPSGNYI